MSEPVEVFSSDECVFAYCPYSGVCQADGCQHKQRGSGSNAEPPEAGDAGNVDDLVVHRAGQSAFYHQVKFGQDATRPLTCDWFTTSATPNGTTPLQKFWKSFVDLTDNGAPPRMALYTNKPIAPDDPVLKHRSGNNATVAQRLAAQAPGSASGKTRAAWAAHLGISEGDLLQMLAVLAIEAGEPSIQHLTESCQMVMELCQLQHGPAALLAGCGRIRQLIREGHRELGADGIADIIDELGLHADTAQPRGLLLIEAIDHRPALRQAASVSLDWVDLFDGENPNLRRQLQSPENWESTLAPALLQAATELQHAGLTDVLIDGALRLSTGTAAGAALRGVSGFTVAVRNPKTKTEWHSAGPTDDVELASHSHLLGLGEDIAVALAIAGDPTTDVKNYLMTNLPNVGELIVLSLADGPGRDAIATPAQARGVATAVMNELRSAAARHHNAPLHLFQYAPLGLSVLIGHAWNRLPRATLYDDLNNSDLYTPTFVLAA